MVGLCAAERAATYRAAAPAANPGRVPVWVEPYVDITGKGYMVTVSVPVLSHRSLEFDLR